jgi:hypothetical protein
LVCVCAVCVGPPWCAFWRRRRPPPAATRTRRALRRTQRREHARRGRWCSQLRKNDTHTRTHTSTHLCRHPQRRQHGLRQSTSVSLRQCCGSACSVSDRPRLRPPPPPSPPTRRAAAQAYQRKQPPRAAKNAPPRRLVDEYEGEGGAGAAGRLPVQCDEEEVAHKVTKTLRTTMSRLRSHLSFYFLLLLLLRHRERRHSQKLVTRLDCRDVPARRPTR